ncbi:MAG TPA: hypothetical protein VJ782_03700 [Aeromicrobium sp.]|nr:hypothetical protein [Aeromicrobium sp.]
MKSDTWFVLIYQSAYADSQDFLATQLRGLGGLVVHTAQDNGEYFVLIRSRGLISAIELHELVMTFDSEAELVSSHDGTREIDDSSIPRPLAGAEAGGT